MSISTRLAICCAALLSLGIFSQGALGQVQVKGMATKPLFRSEYGVKPIPGIPTWMLEKKHNLDPSGRVDFYSVEEIKFSDDYITPYRLELMAKQLEDQNPKNPFEKGKVFPMHAVDLNIQPQRMNWLEGPPSMPWLSFGKNNP